MADEKVTAGDLEGLFKEMPEASLRLQIQVQKRIIAELEAEIESLKQSQKGGTSAKSR